MQSLKSLKHSKRTSKQSIPWSNVWLRPEGLNEPQPASGQTLKMKKQLVLTSLETILLLYPP